MATLDTAPERIVVAHTAPLGEVLFATPLIRVLKLAWPAAHLTLVSAPEVAALAGCVPGVDRVLALSTRGGLSALRRVARELGEPQLVLVPNVSLRNAALAWLTKAQVRVGGDLSLLRRFFTVRVPVKTREPFVQRAMDLARALGIEGPTDLQLAAPPAELEAARGQLGDEPSLGLVLAAEGPTRRWPPGSFALLAEQAREAGLRPVLLGDPDDRDDRDAAEAVKAKARVPLLDMTGAGLLPTVAAMALMRAVVGGDTALSHAARALGTPALLLFGPTDPGAHTLEHHAQALRLGLDCQPCGSAGAKLCPFAHHDCLRKLEADRVWNAVVHLLAREGRQ
ncbi:MAG: glycosyltransferase family 9 protein [Deltaproteobacteria bacterium]|nr:glycosyltransferase family 9 protein [Deltaproteobacteria bacterium]